MAIKAVVFDVGGVLERVEDDTWPQAWLARWERLANLPAGHALAALAEHEPWDGIVTGEVSEDQLRGVYAQALGLNDDQADQMMAEMWEHYCGELDLELADLPPGSAPTTPLRSSATPQTEPDGRNNDATNLRTL